MSLEIEGLAKRFGEVRAVEAIDLSVRRGEFFTLLGPSGCGKTTILRVTAGIYPADAGRVRLDGVDVTAAPMHARNMALVFQNYALFPHLSVFENVAFGLKMRRLARAEIAARVAEALALVRLEALGGRYPDQLSGGQQQRVSLARALVIRPALLLLDEPLSNLDARLREEMRGEIRELQRRLHVTTVLVTHDIEEAFAMSDRIAVLRAGRIEQVGLPAELYRRPANRFVANFVGPMNELAVTALAAAPGGALATTAEGLAVRVAAEVPPGGDAKALSLMIRPEALRLFAAEGETDNRYEAVVEDLVYLGGQTSCRLAVGSARLTAMVPSAAASELVLGDRVAIGWNAEDCVIGHGG
ncbi:MAG: ABC transporter ATP-binding protein [Alphaproteobacteria bacterium]